MARVAVGGVDDDFVAAGLEGEGHVDDEAFCTANAKVWVNYCYVGGLAWHFCVVSEGVVRGSVRRGSTCRFKTRGGLGIM